LSVPESIAALNNPSASPDIAIAIDRNPSVSSYIAVGSRCIANVSSRITNGSGHVTNGLRSLLDVLPYVTSASDDIAFAGAIALHATGTISSLPQSIAHCTKRWHNFFYRKKQTGYLQAGV
jgi:hypothetical protein